MNTLQERAVLMRLSISVPGQERKDENMSREVKADHALGADAGEWRKHLWPKHALAEVKKLDTAARTYHSSVTLPWDSGIGILPAPLYFDYTMKMADFANRRSVLIGKFVAQGQSWVDWAVDQHNGTFDPNLYPGCVFDEATQKYVVDSDVFSDSMRSKFEFNSAPMPVPESSHFTATISSLLGTDTAAVDQRVVEATKEGQRELMRRLIEPVAEMARKLAEQPKLGKDGKQKEDIIFRDSLVTNIRDIAAVAGLLNMTDDPMITTFIEQADKLSAIKPELLREDLRARADVQKKAEELAQRMKDYQF